MYVNISLKKKIIIISNRNNRTRTTTVLVYNKNKYVPLLGCIDVENILLQTEMNANISVEINRKKRNIVFFFFFNTIIVQQCCIARTVLENIFITTER